MKTSVYHIQINISDPKVSLPFYKELFKYFADRHELAMFETKETLKIN